MPGPGENGVRGVEAYETVVGVFPSRPAVEFVSARRRSRPEPQAQSELSVRCSCDKEPVPVTGFLFVVIGR